MKLRWLGHACFQMIFEDGRSLVTDPFDESVGYPVPETHAHIVTMSHAHHDHNCVSGLQGPFRIINTKGVHEVSGVKITGIPCYHDDQRGALRGENLIFVIEADGLKIAHLGDLGHMPDDHQMAALANLDLLLIPVGGYYTIDSSVAADIAHVLKPSLTVPMHYKTRYINYPISDERAFLCLMGGEYAGSGEIEVARGAPGEKRRVVALAFE